MLIKIIFAFKTVICYILSPIQGLSFVIYQQQSHFSSGESLSWTLQSVVVMQYSICIADALSYSWLFAYCHSIASSINSGFIPRVSRLMNMILVTLPALSRKPNNHLMKTIRTDETRWAGADKLVLTTLTWPIYGSDFDWRWINVCFSFVYYEKRIMAYYPTGPFYANAVDCIKGQSQSYINDGDDYFKIPFWANTGWRTATDLRCPIMIIY